MTPADLAAALGVDVDRVGETIHGAPSCKDGDRMWIARASTLSVVVGNGQPTDIVIRVPITTTLKAAVAHIRAMLAVEPKEPTP